MNRVFPSIVMAMGIMSAANAQMTSGMSHPLSHDAVDTILVSRVTDGDYLVSRMLIKETSPDNNEFEVRYQINLSKLISTYDNNAAEIEGLNNFIESMTQDSLKSITQFKIVGYASPDGPKSLNDKLSNARAQDFCAYIEQKYDMADYPHSVSAVASQWVDTKQAVMNSSLSNKAEVISLVESSAPQMTIESKLKAMPQTWDYFKTTILPPMRCVAIHVKYNSWRSVEERLLIEQPKPTVVVEVREKCSYEQMDDGVTGLLFMNPSQVLDYDTEKVKAKANRRKAKLKATDRGEWGSEKLKEKERGGRWKW